MFQDIERFLAEHDYSTETLEKYRRFLGDLAVVLAEKGLAPEATSSTDLRQWLDGRTTWGPMMKYVASCATRGFFRWRFGEVHPAAHFRMKRPTAGPQRTLAADELSKILAACEGDAEVAIRNRALVMLALDTGLRSSELCGLETRHVDLEQRVLTAFVKGRKWRQAWFSKPTAEAVAHWLGIRQRIARAGVSTVFVALGGRRNARSARGEPLARYGLTVIMRYLARRAGVRTFGPHSFRRSMCVNALRRNAPSRVVQKMGGWSSIEMVEVYSRNMELSAGDLDCFFVTSEGE